MKRKLFLFATLCVLLNISLKAQDLNTVNKSKVTIKNGIDNILIGATLSVPQHHNLETIVILISGSGPHDRDATVPGMVVKPFKKTADYLTGQGISVLRYDDRGMGISEGDDFRAGVDNYVKDVNALITFIKEKPELKKYRLGLIGHSLGAEVAPIVSKDNDEVDFIVLMAGSGINGKESLLLQKATIERQMGVNEEIIQAAQKNIGGLHDVAIQNQNIDTLPEELKAYCIKTFGSGLSENAIEQLTGSYYIPWFRDILKYEPSNYLANTKKPILALYGQLDVQVTPKENSEGMKVLLANNPKATVKVLPRMNHLFQEAETGSLEEYATIKDPISDKVLSEISSWIKSNIK